MSDELSVARKTGVSPRPDVQGDHCGVEWQRNVGGEDDRVARRNYLDRLLAPEQPPKPVVHIERRTSRASGVAGEVPAGGAPSGNTHGGPAETEGR